MNSRRTLTVIPACGVHVKPDGLFMDIKFVSGMQKYAALWNGAVSCVMRPVPKAELPFGRLYDQKELSFGVTISEEILPQHLSDTAIASIAVERSIDFSAAEMCKRNHIPYVTVIVNTLKNRFEILRTERKSWPRLLRGYQWLACEEMRRKKVLQGAAGIQAYHVQAFERYARYSENSLMVFDSRSDHLIEEDALETRLSKLDQAEPLRLVFTGRLVAIKGVDHFIALMDHLENATLDVYGAGPMAEILVHPRIKLHGAVDFETALMPAVRSSADLFLCCHRQGDPSGTYIETLACGVPFAGYANDALKGLIDLAKVGQTVPVNDIRGLATLIRTLDQDRSQIKSMARKARSFAEKHTFSKTFEARIQHLRQCAGMAN